MTAWLLDAGPLVAFFDRSDADHEWAKEQWSQAPVPMLTKPKFQVYRRFERQVIPLAAPD